MTDRRRRILVMALVLGLAGGGATICVRWITSAEYKVARVLDLGRNDSTAPLRIRILRVFGKGEMSPIGIEEELHAFGPSAIPALIRALDDPDHNVRMMALLGLRGRRDLRVVRALLKLADARDESTRGMVNGLLGTIVPDGGEEIVGELISSLKAPDPAIRSAATFWLAQSRDVRAEGLVVGMLNDPDREVRAAAAISLGEFRSPQSRTALINALGDEDHKVKMLATYAIGQRRESTAVPLLVGMLRGTDPDLRLLSARALGQIGQAEALDPLIDAGRSEDPRLREAVREAILKIRRGLPATREDELHGGSRAGS